MAGIFLNYGTGQIEVSAVGMIQLMTQIAFRRSYSLPTDGGKVSQEEKKVQAHWINQILIIKKTSNENVLTEEK